MPQMPRVPTDEANAAVVAADTTQAKDWRYRVLGQTPAQALADAPEDRVLSVPMKMRLAGACAMRARALGLSRAAYLRHLVLADCRAAGFDLDDEMADAPKQKRRAKQ
jgi:hypothetical protein